MFENKHSLQIVSVTPPVWEQFIQELERARKDAVANAKKDVASVEQQYREFRQKMERKWFAAMFYICLESVSAGFFWKSKLNFIKDENGFMQKKKYIKITQKSMPNLVY